MGGGFIVVASGKGGDYVDAREDCGGAEYPRGTISLPEDYEAEEGADDDADLPESEQVADGGEGHRHEDEKVAAPHQRAGHGYPPPRVPPLGPDVAPAPAA